MDNIVQLYRMNREFFVTLNNQETWNWFPSKIVRFS